MLIIIVQPPLQYAFILSPCTCYYIVMYVMYVVILCSFAMFYTVYCIVYNMSQSHFIFGPIILECVLLHKTVVESRVYTYVHTNGTYECIRTYTYTYIIQITCPMAMCSNHDNHALSTSVLAIILK